MADEDSTRPNLVSSFPTFYEILSLASHEFCLDPLDLSKYENGELLATFLFDSDPLRMATASPSLTATSIMHCEPSALDTCDPLDANPLTRNASPHSPAEMTDSENSALNNGLASTKPIRQTSKRKTRVVIQHRSESSSPDPDDPRPRDHICSTCNAKFLRLQDRKRHEATHMPKQFVCPYDGVKFARRDALGRHWKSSTCLKHENEFISADV
ncbi:hypothetical protein HDU79_010806 [Rhizoclosmatium sp. JEL0117]|nr:hypothetical protein HDU79_010806 [Rhizoclosmatium sp. JEL0117]